MSNRNGNAIGGPFGEDDDIGVLHISLRAYNALHRAEITRISALMTLTDGQLVSVRGLGATSIAEIRRALERFVGDEIDALRTGQLPAAAAPVSPEPAGLHPVEVARTALREAAALSKDEDWAYMLRRMAKSLPEPEWLDRDRNED
jgi:hypothetical protein